MGVITWYTVPGARGASEHAASAPPHGVTGQKRFSLASTPS
jgi:hypothetical protein